MTNEVIWSPESEDDLSIILEYLVKEWNFKVATSFLNEVEQHIKRISDNPKLCPVIYKKQQFRQCVVTRHNSLIYSHKRNTLIILRIFDTRQNPKKLIFQ